MGGQTALNCALELEDKTRCLEKYNVDMIGATAEAIFKAEDRKQFDTAMKNIGLETPKASVVQSMDAALEAIETIGFPCIIRPSFTMGGSGGGIAYNMEEFKEICRNAI